MKIIDVRCATYLRRNTRPGCMVALVADCGLTGIGVGPSAARATAQILADDMLRGRDPRATATHWQRLAAMRDREPEPEAIARAAAVLDMALWDLKTKALGEPLWKALGASRPRPRVHASAAAPLDEDAELQWLGAMVRDHGLGAAKLAVGSDPDADLRRLTAWRDTLRQAVPGAAQGAELMVDAGERWTPKVATRRIREMERDFDLTWLEGAAQHWDFPGLRRISAAVRTAVCVGRGMHMPHAFLPHFHHRAVDVVQIDIGCTGISGALQLADAAYGFELPVTLCAAPGNVHAHLAAAMPGFMSMEITEVRPPTDAFTTDIRIEHGRAVAGDAPGLGLTVDHDAFAGDTVC